MKFNGKLRSFARSIPAKISAGTTALVVSASALASGSSSPGAAMAAELSGGKAEIGLVIAACAVLVGVLLLWAYTRRAAK